MVVDNFSKDDNLIELQTTSQYNPVIDTNISFYESDRGTGVLNFAVTKNNKPLSISKHNAMTSIVLSTMNTALILVMNLQLLMQLMDECNTLSQTSS
ncbi:BppU family phage baseplate upper protein [Streptococcus pneumoniae]|uniref:BppU family phage baseplate upper protein n=1 Tax=Streptococcus pneumoniae TaxID=1313 RepID=UPI00258D26AE|nr:BppU family phage baseplate upper protein [Streptococcus pneumoniae]